MFMAGCSKNNPQLPPDEDAWVYDLSLPVPIQFGTGLAPELVTKVGYESITDFNTNVRFRVFGVDTDYTKYPKWEKDADGNLPDGVILHHAPARFNNSKIEFTSYDNAEGVTKAVKYYYPIESVCNYTFYAYHLLPNSAPDQNDVGLYNSQKLKFQKDPDSEYGGYYATDVKFGPLDLLWAKTEVAETADIDPSIHIPNKVEVGKDGFNAAYCRAVRGSTNPVVKDNQGSYMPNFAFEHITAALLFYAAQGSVGDFSTIKVKNIRVMNAVPSATLCIAHQTDPSKEKQWSELADPVTMTMSGIPTDGVEPAAGEGAMVGNGLFLCPQENFQIEIDFSSLDFNGKPKTYTMKRTVSAAGGFKAGHKYSFTILLNPSELMDITISTTTFEDSTGDLIDDDDDDEEDDGNVFDENNVES